MRTEKKSSGQNIAGKTEPRPISIRTYAWALGCIWTFIVFGSLLWEVHHTRQGILDLARSQARVAYEKDVVYRRWNASFGGVYVPVTDKSSPNPYLHIPDRDIATPSGVTLTLMNPAYMTRQVHELAAEVYGVQGHITSLSPVRPSNAPDPWEKKALEAFQNGAKEISSVEQIHGEPYLRLMRPLFTEQGCLKCHAAQGYKVGDIRGGISVSLPMASLLAVQRSRISTLWVEHVFFWLCGMTGLIFAMWRIGLYINEREVAKEALQQSAEVLKATLEATADGILVVSEKDEVISCNARFSEMWRIPKDLMATRKDTKLLEHVLPQLEEPEVFLSKIRALYASSDEIFDILKFKDGRFFERFSSPLIQHGKLAGRVWSYRDVTSQKTAEESLRTSEENYKNLFENASEAIFVAQGGKLVFFNPVTSSMIGCSAEELLSKPFVEFIHPDDRAIVSERHARRLKGEELPTRYSFRIVRRDGQVRWVELNTIVIKWKDEAATLNFLTDMTDRKNAEEAALAYAERFRVFFSSVNDAIFVHPLVTGGFAPFIEVNDIACQRYGYTREEFLRLTAEDITRQADAVAHAAPDHRQKLLEKGQLVFETVHIKKSGEEFPVEINSNVVEQFGRPVILAVVRDITERKRAEEARSLNESRVETLLKLNQMSDATLQQIASFAMEEAVRLTQSTIGYLAFMNEEETVLTMHAWSRLAMQECRIEDKPTEFLVEAAGIWGEAVRQRRPVIINDYDAHNPLKRGTPAGHVKLIRHMSVPAFDGDRIVVVAGVGNKATDYGAADIRQLTLLMTGMWRIVQRKRAEEALRESQERFQELAELLPETVFEMDVDGKLTFVNKNAPTHFGYTREEFEQGLNGFDLLSPEERPRAVENAQRLINGGRIGRDEYKALRKDGSTFPAILHSSVKFCDGKPAGFRGIVIDITETKRLEAQLRQAHKMEAIGTLAGGIAHDFNNLLQAVLGYSDLLLFKKTEGQKGYQELLEINRAAKRGSDLTRQLLTFSRKMEPKLEALDLNRIVEGVRKLLERTIPKMIEIELHLTEDLYVVNADASQMEQVLMNLAVNARDAMPKGGTLTIETRNVSVDNDFRCSRPELNPGNYVRLAVKDTGEGMDKTTLGHIFDPFFTTKEVGKGTGLGLAVVYGIVKSHHGHINCVSKAGEGTLFEIYLPAAEQLGKTSEVSGPAKELRGGDETILLVDDDGAVRDLGMSILRNFGYTVIGVPDGESALQFFRDKRDDIDLVILDLIMPGMGGKRCLRELLELDPSVRVIVASGYLADGESTRIDETWASAFIDKPYDLEQMLQVVREALN